MTKRWFIAVFPSNLKTTGVAMILPVMKISQIADAGAEFRNDDLSIDLFGSNHGLIKDALGEWYPIAAELLDGA